MTEKVKFSLAIAIASIGVLFCGCASIKSDPLAEIKFWSHAAATVGAQEVLAEHPEYRPKLQAAYDSLNTLVNAGHFDGALFHQILSTLGVKELKSREARIAITFATLTLERYGSSVSIDQNQYVAAAMTAVRDGLGEALAVPAAKVQSSAIEVHDLLYRGPATITLTPGIWSGPMTSLGTLSDLRTELKE